MDEKFNKSISINDVTNIIRARKWILIFCLAGTLISVIIHNFTAVPIYRASTKVVFEDTEREMNYNLLGGLNQNFIANQIAEMQTRSFAHDVAEALDEEVRTRFRTLSTYSKKFNFANYVVGQIQGNLSFTPVRGTEVIVIAFDSEDRELAKAVANTTSEVLIERNLEVRRQQYSSMRQFVDEQFEIVKARLQKAEFALKEFKEQEDITSLEDQSKELLERITQAEVAFNEVKTKKKESQKRLSLIQDKLATEKKDLTTNVVRTTNPLATRLKERLVELEVTYTNLQVQGFPETNPKIVELRNEINKVKKNLVDETLKINDEDNMESLIDPFSQIKKYLEESIALDVELKALAAKERHLQSLLSNYSEMMKQLPDKEMKLVRLIRDKEVNDKLYLTLLEEKEKARIKEASKLGNIRVLEPARLPGNPVSPKKLLNLILGVFSGLFLAGVLIFVLEYFNDVIKTQEDIEKVLQLPVIAAIPKLKVNMARLFDFTGNGQTVPKTEDSILLDAFSLLAFALEQRTTSFSTIMLTSSLPGEGKSTVAGMLALASAQRGKKTLLIDGDLRKPTLHSVFGVSREPGLTNLAIEFIQNSNQSSTVPGPHTLNTQSSNGYGSQAPRTDDNVLEDLFNNKVIQTQERNLFFLPCGFIPKNPVRIWSAPWWEKLLAQLGQFMDTIIIDAPPIGVAETTLMLTHIDRIVFCVAANEMDKKSLKRSFKMFANSIPDTKEKILGAVLNKADLVGLYGGYKYYKYYFKKDQSRLIPELPHEAFLKSVSSESANSQGKSG